MLFLLLGYYISADYEVEGLFVIFVHQLLRSCYGSDMYYGYTV